VHFATLLEYGYEQVDRGLCSGHATPMSCRIVFAVLPLSIGVIRAPYPQLKTAVNLCMGRAYVTNNTMLNVGDLIKQILNFKLNS